MFAALAISPQRSISLRIQASSSCGVLPAGEIPRWRTLSANSAEFTTARISARIVAVVVHSRPRCARGPMLLAHLLVLDSPQLSSTIRELIMGRSGGHGQGRLPTERARPETEGAGHVRRWARALVTS